MPERSHVLISGIRRGLGQAVAKRRAAAGDAVSGFAKHADGLEDLGRELAAAGARANVLQAADLADRESVAAFTTAAAQTLGPPNIIIHSAAVLGPRTRLMEVAPTAWREVMEINVNGTLVMLQQTAAVADPDRPTLWIWLTSSVGARGRASWGPYAASKAALENLSESFADEVGDRPWTSVCLNPGGTRTAMRNEAYPNEDPASLPSPDEVAAAFDLVIDRWRAGELANGSRHNARDLIPGLGD